MFDLTMRQGWTRTPRSCYDLGESGRDGGDTISHRDYKDRRLLVVQPLGLEGEAPDDDFIALDSTQAGIGDTVLVKP